MLTKEEENNAQNLFQSARNIRRASAHLDALMNNLKELIEKKAFDNGEVCFNEKVDDEYAGTDWIATSRSMHAEIWTDKPADKRKKQKQFGTISLHIILDDGSDEGIVLNWPWRYQPSLIVCWSRPESKSPDWEDYYFYAENFDPEDEDNAECINSMSARIWQWKREGEESYGCFFAIPIFSLRDENDLRKHVVKPLTKLFEGKDEKESFPEDSPTFLTGYPAS